MIPKSDLWVNSLRVLLLRNPWVIFYALIKESLLMNMRHQELLTWLKSVTEEGVAETGTTVGYLRRIAYGQKTASAEMAAGIERATAGQVTRKALRPADWHLIWPELSEVPPTLKANLRLNSSPDQSCEGAVNSSSSTGAQ